MAVHWDKITAIFGGTFDPPHLGHLEAVQGLLSDFPRVKQVWVMPAGVPALKGAPSIPARERLRLCELQFGELPGVRVDAREIERCERTGQRTTTYETLQELRAELGNDSVAFVIGLDQLHQLPRWHRFPEVLGLCHWVVLERKGLTGYPSALPGFVSQCKSLTVVPTQARALSSTAIREAFARTGAFPDGALHPSVNAYLKQSGIYGTVR